MKPLLKDDKMFYEQIVVQCNGLQNRFFHQKISGKDLSELETNQNLMTTFEQL